MSQLMTLASRGVNEHFILDKSEYHEKGNGNGQESKVSRLSTLPNLEHFCRQQCLSQPKSSGSFNPRRCYFSCIATVVLGLRDQLLEEESL